METLKRTEAAVGQLRERLEQAVTLPGGEALKDLDISKLILFNTRELCSLKGIGRRTAYKWRMDGTISYLRIQGKIYYRLYDILNDMEELSYRNDPFISKK